LSSNESSQSPSSQVPLYLWGDSDVYKKWFVANLHLFHCVVIEAEFQKWHDTFASAIHKSVHVRGVFCAVECALSQCTPNIYWAIIYFDNLNCFFKLGLTVEEFFYFFKVRRCEKYAQLCVSNAKMFDSFSQGHHVWNADVLEIRGKWEVKDITQKLDLRLDMAKSVRH
ncbi:unnamed protein product, partial [Prunus brigantina]